MYYAIKQYEKYEESQRIVEMFSQWKEIKDMSLGETPNQFSSKYNSNRSFMTLSFPSPQIIESNIL